MQIRENRLLGLNAHRDDDQYIDQPAVAEEVAYSRRLCAKHNWPMIDVTRRSIEETAAAVMWLLAERRRQAERVIRRPLWLGRATAGARIRSADARGDAGGGRPSVRDRAGADRRARGRGAQPARDAGRSCAAAGARQGRAVAQDMPGRLVLGADQTLALRRGAFRQAGRSRGRRASSCAALRGQTHELHSALALVRDGEVLFDCVDTARLTMRSLSDRFLEAYLDVAGRRGARQRRRLSARRARHPSVRAHRGRLLHHSRPAAVAAARFPASKAGLLQ